MNDIKGTILGLLKNIKSALPWVKMVAEFVESKETRLLSNKPGTSRADVLLADSKIHLQTTKNANIKTIGMEELINKLSSINEGEIIRSYIFEDDKQTCIIYLHDDSGLLIGAVLVPRGKRRQTL